MKMNTKEFCVEPARTLSCEFYMDTRSKLNLLHGAIGIMTEVVELVEAINIKGEIKDRTNFLEELADIDWYAAIFYRELFLPTDRQQVTHGSSSILEIVIELNSLSAKLLDLFKKYSYYGKEINSTVVTELVFEIEDRLIELALRANSTLDEARYAVINKLRVRYPEKFTSELADNRNLEAERKELNKV